LRRAALNSSNHAIADRASQIEARAMQEIQRRNRSHVNRLA